MKKTCKKCNKEKKIDKFVPHKNAKDGYENRCKECARIYAKSKAKLKGTPRGPKKGYKFLTPRKYTKPLLNYTENEIIKWVNKIKKIGKYYVPYKSNSRSSEYFKTEKSLMNSIGWKLDNDSKILFYFYYRKLILNSNFCKGCNIPLSKEYVVNSPNRGKHLIEWCEKCYTNKEWMVKVLKKAHSPESRKKAMKTKESWYGSDEGIEWRKEIGENNAITTKRWRDNQSKEERLITNEKSSKSQIKNILNGSFDPQKNYKHFKKNKCYIDNKEYIFRSSWEVIFAISNPNLEYESLRIPYIKDNGKSGVYIPDFIDIKNKIIYELKPRRNFQKQQVKMDASIKWCLENNYTFIWVNEDNLLNYISGKDNKDIRNKKFYEKAYLGLNGNFKNKINKKNRKNLQSL